MKIKEYLDIGGDEYFINLKALESLIKIKDSTPQKQTESRQTFNTGGVLVGTELVTSETGRGVEINGALFEVLNNMLNILLNYRDEIDETLGIERALSRLPLNFKFAFNTLCKYGILQKIR